MKILCIGNSSEDTDQQASILAQQNNLINHGLLSDLEGTVCFESRTQLPGVYHTSFVDLCFERVSAALDCFDRICLLDQPIQQWNTTTEFYDTINYAVLLDNRVEWQNERSRKNFLYWKDKLHNNRSFCIWPFVQMSLYDSYATVCCVSSRKLENTQGVEDFNNETYRDIRQKLISGKQIDHCRVCYRLEEKGIESPRQQQTLEWATRLDLSGVEDLSEITSPISLEINLDNMCNLQCRMCGPSASSLIEKEYKKLGIITGDFGANVSTNKLDGLLDVPNLQKLYFTGGEPTANARVYDFLEQAVAQRKTDVVLQINTNAWKISDKFVNLVSQFDKAEFFVSIDAFDRVNDYIRWPSDWRTVQTNVARLIDVGKVSFTVSLSLYGIFSFRDLMMFLDQQYPGHYVHCQLVTNQSPFMIPYRSDEIETVKQIRDLSLYKNLPGLQNFVDGLIEQMQQSKLQKRALKDFFEFNDLLDRSRGCELADYIPELVNLRNLL